MWCVYLCVVVCVLDVFLCVLCVFLGANVCFDVFVCVGVYLWGFVLSLCVLCVFFGVSVCLYLFVCACECWCV